jgi:hypothetical protein
MRIPRGELVRSRVVGSAAEPLRDALDRGLTGYLRLEPGDTVLLDDETTGVITVAEGVPVLAYEAATDRGGRAALDAVAAPGPYRAELHAVAPDAMADAHDEPDPGLAVPPAAPADRLAGDPALVDRTREAAPDARLADEPAGPGPDAGGLEAFLADEERVAAVREEARAEARSRAAEWGLTDQLAAAADAGTGPGSESKPAPEPESESESVSGPEPDRPLDPDATGRD